MREVWERLCIATGKFLPSCSAIWALVPLAQDSCCSQEAFSLYAYLCLWIKALIVAGRVFFSFFQGSLWLILFWQGSLWPIFFRGFLERSQVTWFGSFGEEGLLSRRFLTVNIKGRGKKQRKKWAEPPSKFEWAKLFLSGNMTFLQFPINSAIVGALILLLFAPLFLPTQNKCWRIFPDNPLRRSSQSPLFSRQRKDEVKKILHFTQKHSFFMGLGL